MAFNFNDFLRLAKKAFRWYQNQQKNNQNQQHQQGQGGQQGQQGQQHWQQQGQQHYNNNASPYPQAQGGGARPHGGGYGAHDGPATNQDMANAQNQEYVGLRNQAITEGDLMAQAFQQSKNAFERGDKARAHDLSLEGKEHQRQKDTYNQRAAQWIYNENNRIQPEGSIDLHGLYVNESIHFAELAVQNGRAKNLQEIRIIVGKGNHSPGHVAKLKPAIEDLMQKEQLTAHLDSHNPGVLIVQLQKQGGGKGSREVLDDMDKNADICSIM